MGDFLNEIYKALEKRANYMPQAKDMTGMYGGADLPADGMLIKMIKSDPDAARFYSLAVEKVYNRFQNMKEEVKRNVPTQEDMARMFNDPAMSDLGTLDGAGMPGQDQQQGMPPQGMAGQMPQDLSGMQTSLPEGTMLDEQGNPIPPEQQQVDEQGNPIQAEQQPLDEQGNPIPPEQQPLDEQGNPIPIEEDVPEEAEEEKEEDMYPFGQKLDKKKKKKKKSPNSEGEPGQEESPTNDLVPQEKVASEDEEDDEDKDEEDEDKEKDKDKDKKPYPFWKRFKKKKKGDKEESSHKKESSSPLEDLLKQILGN